MSAEATAATALPALLLLYDGVCGLCDRTVQFLLDHDPEGVLSYAPIQGATAAAILARHPALAGIDSVVLVEQTPAGERVTVRSKAVFRVLGRLRGAPRWARWASALTVVPSPLLDWGYDLVAATRYRIFGKLETCRVPDATVRGRFLA